MPVFHSLWENPHRICVNGRGFYKLKASRVSIPTLVMMESLTDKPVYSRHIEVKHNIGLERCPECGLRLGHDTMGRHRASKYCRGQNREPEIP